MAAAAGQRAVKHGAGQSGETPRLPGLTDAPGPGGAVPKGPVPFLKWVGGKRQLLPELLRRIGRLATFGAYHEPFVGGGALFFELWSRGRLSGPVRLSDNNPNLIAAYEGVKYAVEQVIELLREHARRHDKEHYYATRAARPDSLAAQAARIIYLNRTCFNGLFRENSRGEFNVPMGRYVNPRICDEANLRAAAEALRDVRIDTAPFDSVVEAAAPGDLVYFDPPYHPVSATANFTAYQRDGFGEDDQRALAGVFRALDANGVHVLLSNSCTEFVRGLYADFVVENVSASRCVNSRADRRGPVWEVLVGNF